MQEIAVTIVGGGIVGLATAFRLAQSPNNYRIALVEKESELAHHQTGRNSGVLHSGIYYRPGSQKALTCRAGKASMEKFCQEEAIPFEICGKVIVAVEERELPVLQQLVERGQANGVDCRLIEKEELAEIEPHTAGIRAIHVPESGIVDYRVVSERLGRLLRDAGHDIRLGTRVEGLRESAEGVVVTTNTGEWSTGYVINCAGLHSDRVARQASGTAPAQIVPFRG
jgi:L-2-hydroxyglutarate oxidase LhgO